MKNIVQMYGIVLALIIAGFAYFGLPLYGEWVHFKFLTEMTPIQKAEWKVKVVGEEDYRIEVDYDYQVDGTNYHKSEVLKGEKYRNPYKAEGAIPELKEDHQIVYFNPKDPEDALIDTYFPTKKAVYLLILFGLFNYFLILVSKYSKEKLKEHKKPEGKSGKGRS
jgi:hypothetical protein